MSKREIPYKPGTKSFLVAQRLLKGESYDTIEREVGVERKTISNVKSRLKGRGLLITSGSPATSRTSSSSPGVPTVPSGEGGGEVPSGRTESTSRPRVAPTEPSMEGERIFERELWVIAQPIIRKVALNPKIFLFYDYARTELGFDGDLGDFIVDCVQDFFNSRNIKIKIVREKEVA